VSLRKGLKTVFILNRISGAKYHGLHRTAHFITHLPVLYAINNIRTENRTRTRGQPNQSSYHYYYSYDRKYLHVNHCA